MSTKPTDITPILQASKAEEMADKIKEIIYSYGDLVPLALAVGVLAIVQRDLIEDARE